MTLMAKAEGFDTSCMQCVVGGHYCIHCGVTVIHNNTECALCRPTKLVEKELDANIILGEE